MFQRAIEGRHGFWMIVAAGVLLSLPSLAIGLVTDDRVIAGGVASGRDIGSLYLFEADDVARARETGQLSWWSSPRLSIKFFRPLPLFIHWVEFGAWPGAAWAMHLVNVALYAALVVIAWHAYKEFLPDAPAVAALAALMFAIDDGHAVSVAWIASRNTLLAGLFVLAALVAYVRARRGSRAWRVAAVGCCALGLLSSESGVAAVAYLAAYALVFEADSVWRRVARLWPELCVTLAWAVVYTSGGFGVRGAGYYRDVSEPLPVMLEGVLDLPIWLTSLFGPSIANGLVAFPAAPVRLAALVLILPLLAAIVRVLPWTRENRFFALGALFCLAPFLLTAPQDRLLIAASFGAFGLLASFIVTAKTSASRYVRAARGVMLGLHLVLAPASFLILQVQLRSVERASRALSAAVPEGTSAQVVLVRAPVELGFYAWEFLFERSVRPEWMRQLYAGSAAVAVERIDAYTLEVRADGGWGRLPFERVWGAVRDMPRAGSRVDLGAMSIEVRATESDGRPSVVRFRWSTPLESSDRVWLTWEGAEPRRWPPPAIGRTVRFSPLDLFESLPAW